MTAGANLVEVAALVGDTARATMLAALMDGRSLTATELAYCANVSRSTASGHLSKLAAARLLTVKRHRRFSYYRIASPLVARMLEASRSSPQSNCRPDIGPALLATKRFGSPGPATITLPVRPVSRLPMRCRQRDTSCSPKMVAS